LGSDVITETVGRESPALFSLANWWAFFAQQKGGDDLTSFVGHKAILEGYNGVVFFSTRNIERWWSNPGSMEYNALPAFMHQSMREDPTCINVVIFYAHNVVRATRYIRSWKTILRNNLCLATISTIDDIFANDPKRPPEIDLSYESARERSEEIYWRPSPRFERRRASQRGETGAEHET
jgi:hypothetical protein